MAENNSPTLAVVGHSFVRRLGEFTLGLHLHLADRPAHHERYNNLRLDSEHVIYFGIGGAKLSGGKPFFKPLHDKLHQFHFKAIYLDLGSNDLCDPNSCPEKVASHIISAANFIISSYSVNTIIVGQIIFRVNEPYPGYNLKVTDTNEWLRDKIARSPGQKIQFARLRGLLEPQSDIFLPDGVHLNAQGNKIYAQGVRGAFIRALRPSDQ